MRTAAEANALFRASDFGALRRANLACYVIDPPSIATSSIWKVRATSVPVAPSATLTTVAEAEDLGSWTLDLGPWTLDLGPWTLDLGPWTLELVPLVLHVTVVQNRAVPKPKTTNASGCSDF